MISLFKAKILDKGIRRPKAIVKINTNFISKMKRKIICKMKNSTETVHFFYLTYKI